MTYREIGTDVNPAPLPQLNWSGMEGLTIGQIMGRRLWYMVSPIIMIRLDTVPWSYKSSA